MIAVVLFLAVAAAAPAQTTDDLVFIHHSCGRNWLNNSLEAALLAKDYTDERNDIYYGTDIAPDTGRPDSLGPAPGDRTNMNHWVPWFNDYLGGVSSHGCANGVNRIVMFKSCYPISNIGSDGAEPGDPFSPSQTLTNYKAVYRHPDGAGMTYSDGGYTYKPLEDVFAENPDTLFIPVTAPPRHYAPSDATNDAEAHRARLFNDWLKGDWLDSYNTANPGLNNVAVFDWFDVLSNPDDHPDHPNRLKAEYGGESGNSHPNSTANQDSTDLFATDPGNFIDAAWLSFTGVPGDYDADTDVDADDVDELCANIGTSDPALLDTMDLDLDGDVDTDDQLIHVTTLLEYDLNGDDIADGQGTFQADFNTDGSVDLADLTALRTNSGSTGMGFADGDTNCDGSVDLADLTTLRGLSGSSVSEAPEPATMGLLAVGGLALLRRKRT